MNRIALCGFMGCGKSTVASALEKKYKLKHIDTDKYIEEKENMTISEIFSTFSENYFRDKEYDAICSLSENDGLVLALGGGAVMFSRNVKALKDNGYKIVFINTDLCVIKERLKNDTTRPLLKTNDIDALYNKRFNIYKENSDLCINCKDEDADTLADIIIESIEGEGKNP